MKWRFAKQTVVSLVIPLMVLPLWGFKERGSASSSASGALAETARMHEARASHTSTLLPNGKVLVAGGFGGSGTEGHPYPTTELYDPQSQSFRIASNMTFGRAGHTATLLKNGKVLIVGGWTGRYDVRRAAELYDPETNSFARTGDMVIEQADSTATLLADGRVLVAGGVDRKENALASGELYDPETGSFSLTGDMGEARGAHTATALKNGKVLIAGGGSGHYPSQTVYRSAELFDPATGKFSSVGPMNIARHKHAAVTLASGRVLIVGGSDNRDWRGEYSSAEVFDPATGTFSVTGSMNTSRFKLPQAVVLLSNGKVLITGGGSFAEVYDEAMGKFILVEGSLGAARLFASATLLSNGKVLITGGYSDSGSGLPSTAAAWIYRP
jgi:hypothetical protein